MSDFNLDELMHLAQSDLELFEQKRLEILASFMDSFAYSPAIKKLVRIQKTIDQQVSFQVVNNDPDLFEQKRQEIITAFINSVLPSEGQDDLLTIQKTIDKACSEISTS